jgi:tRNA 2-thiocytidine biosynthesis protein TtcA
MPPASTGQALKPLNSAVGQALHRYRMISDGDRIAVGLSGGKDSLALLWVLAHRRRYVPVRYDITAIHVDPGFDRGFAGPLEAYCKDAGYPIRVDYSDCGRIAHSAANRENPCFLCSRLRRKRIFEIAAELDCNKVALGHTKDDLIATLLINMFYAGEISTMKPSQSFFNGRFVLIRPLALADEDLIRRFSQERHFPEFVNPCPSAQTSKRHQIKTMLEGFYRQNPKVRGNIFRAMGRVKTDYLPGDSNGYRHHH